MNLLVSESAPLLTVLGGLPGTGKSTVAEIVARRTRTAYVRVDRIEQAVVDRTSLTHPVGPVGYAIAHGLAREQLQLGLDVIVECVNPLHLTRDAWVETATAAPAAILEVEIVCSDEDQHRHRLATRPTDVEGLVKPTWSAVSTRAYEPWTRPRLVVDTAAVAPEDAATMIIEAGRHLVGPGAGRHRT